MTRASIVKSARSCLGTRYRDNGSLPGIAMDCAGLLLFCARDNGVVVPPINYDSQLDKLVMVEDWLNRFCNEVQNLKTGSMILMRNTTIPPLFYHHLAVYTGELSIIHGYKQVGKILEERWDGAWTRFFFKAYDLKGITD